jgi:hypothetical protein
MLSSYMLELSPDVLARYTEKLKVIDNVDPFLLLEFRKAKLSSKIEQFPPIDKSDITMYFTKSRSPYSDEEIKAYKSLESYKYYESKYVREMYVKSFDRVKLIMGIVQRALRGDLVSCWIVTDLNGFVRFAHCKCDAGQGEFCSHVGALLFAIRATQKVSIYWFYFSLV